jgi:hypothetical protein
MYRLICNVRAPQKENDDWKQSCAYLYWNRNGKRRNCRPHPRERLLQRRTVLAYDAARGFLGVHHGVSFVVRTYGILRVL